jgi:NADH dehydrogenase
MGRPSLRVVVIGAGFGGLEASRALARAPVSLTILDRQNHHLFQPLLYQVATAALSPGDIAWPVRTIFRRQANATVLMAEVTAVDTRARLVHADAKAIPYDVLVLATGATHSYFGKDEWAAVAPGLKTIEDATAIRRRLLVAFERAELASDEAERRRLLTFVVVGGGPTGVELAGAMAELSRHALQREFRHVDPRKARILLVEAGPRLLATFPEDLSNYATRSLRRMGVEVRTDARVTNCDAGGVSLGNERIEASTTVWAAGVVASPAGSWIGAERDRAGRVVAGPDLSVPGHPEIFVVGDLVTAKDGKGKPIPGNAPAPPPFAYRHQGDLATIGRRSAVVALDGFRLKGLLGWWFWGIAHVWYLIGFRSRVVVSFEWLWSYITFQRGARLITRLEPRSTTQQAPPSGETTAPGPQAPQRAKATARPGG